MSDNVSGLRKKKRKLNPPTDQRNQFPTGPAITQSNTGNMTTTDDDRITDTNDEESKMFEVPPDKAITTQ